jgi:hypothetical protein
VEEFLHQQGIDVAEKVLDRLVLDNGVCDGDRAWQNTDTLGSWSKTASTFSAAQRVLFHEFVSNDRA